MPAARNDEEVKAMLTPALVQAMQYVADRIYDENITIVNKVVYMAGAGSSRTHDLLTAWRASSSGGGGTARGKFEFEPGKMHSHPSWVPGGGVVHAELIDIVYHGLAGNFGWSPIGPAHASEDPRFSGRYWAGPRDAWKVLVKTVGPKKICKFFEAGMSQAGLKYIVRSRGIGVSQNGDN